MINRLVGLPLAILGAMVFVSSAHAQGHGAFSSAPGGRAGMVGSGRRGGRPIAGLRRSHHSSTGSGYVPYFYDDYDSEPEMSEPSPQTVEATAQPAPRQQCRNQDWCSNCKATIGCDSQITASRRPAHKPASLCWSPDPSHLLQPLLPTLTGLRLRNPLASFHLPCWSFATGITRKSENIRSWAPPYTPARTIGTAGRGHERFKLRTWTFPRL